MVASVAFVGLVFALRHNVSAAAFELVMLLLSASSLVRSAAERRLRG